MFLFFFIFIRMAMRISTICDYIVVLFALHSIIRTSYYTNIIYIFVMYGTLRSSKVLEILQIIKHINYSNLSASRHRIFFGDACTEIAMKFALRIYDFIE